MSSKEKPVLKDLTSVRLCEIPTDIVSDLRDFAYEKMVHAQQEREILDRAASSDYIRDADATAIIETAANNAEVERRCWDRVYTSFSLACAPAFEN